ncbi:protease adaptor protein RcdA [Bosea sp. (in: a-proteobacteria)]|uniref:protease adaptor protein RcdA n=1 Tax=Bosea sp. (in: a-proteobacteria) TaxID=1871050 RepID=UPI002FC8872D
MTDFPMLKLAPEDGAISFARSFVKSDAFMQLFREGMGLVELTAGYLDGDGRAESAALAREVSLTYATESMRLTTRLMQIASWLLVQRAVAEGEMTAEQARTEKNKVRIAEPMLKPSSAEAARLPERLRDLIAHSIRLQERIRHLEDQMSEAAAPAAPANPVRGQLESLQARLGLIR